ncbi:MAG: UpxY family transcription antiterminator [Bryobacteraceae bacterium]
MLSTNRETSTESRAFPEAPKHPWFALRVKSNHEKAVCSSLAVKGFEVFLPICRTRNRWADRFKLVETPLFGGYVFSRLDRTRPNAILSTPGVLQIVGTGRHPEPVLEGEISAIRRAVDANFQLRECDFFMKGQRATVMSGALAGLEGTVVSLKQQSRLVLSISLLQRSVALEIDESLVRIEPDPAMLRYAVQAERGAANRLAGRRAS